MSMHFSFENKKMTLTEFTVKLSNETIISITIFSPDKQMFKDITKEGSTTVQVFTSFKS